MRRLGGRSPTPRAGIYDTYWRFAAARQAVFDKRAAGIPHTLAAPWTDDPILQRYKFCNAFRAADRVSQYLIRDVIEVGRGLEAADLLFQIFAFRLFSKILTWQGLIARLGRAPVLEDLASGAFGAALESLPRPIYTSAFILCAGSPYGAMAKHRTHEALLRDVFFERRLAGDMLAAPSLRALVELLQTLPLIGPFMSYQIAIDLNYSDRFGFSENDFTQAGPGALRGIAKCFEDTGGLSASEIIMWMVARQDEEFARLGLAFGGLFGRKLHAIDCQNLFCETDKYLREAAPGLASNRTRIKAKFAETPGKLPLFFPPKWGINEKMLA